MQHNFGNLNIIFSVLMLLNNTVIDHDKYAIFISSRLRKLTSPSCFSLQTVDELVYYHTISGVVNHIAIYAVTLHRNC